MKTTIRDVKILQYYDGIVTATFNIEQKRYFMFLIAYDVNASQQRMYGAIEVEKGDLPKNLKEKVINSEIVY